jgi:ABC-type oligopeptide transport system ATPase subunit
MAGLAGLPYFLQYQQQAQDNALRHQYAQMQLAQFQQAQRDRQRQQAALEAAGNALPMLLSQQGQAAQMPPPPQAPNPGQPSTPSQPMTAGGAPGQIPPLPPGMPGGMAGATGAAGKPPLPPFQGMPTAGSPAQVTPPQIPAPPVAPAASQQQGPLSLESAIKVLKDQGLSGADLMAGLQQLTPILDSQAKQQAAQIQQQFQHQLQIAQLQERYDSLRQRAEDNALNRADRRQAHDDSMALRRQLIDFQMHGNPEAVLSDDDAKFMAQQYLAAPDSSIFTNLGRGAQGAKNVIKLRQTIMNEAKSQGISPSDLAARGISTFGEKAAARTAGTKAANVGLAAAEAQKTFGIVRQTSEALPRTEFVPVNRALQAAQTNTGDPRVIAFGAALNTAINAYARAISPSGTPTVSDKEHARALLSTANTQDQVNAVLDVMEQEMAAAQQAPREVQGQQRERIAGQSEGRSGGTPSLSDIEAELRRRGVK